MERIYDNVLYLIYSVAGNRHPVKTVFHRNVSGIIYVVRSST